MPHSLPACEWVRQLVRNSHAATAIEYGLIAALIAIAAITAMQGLGSKLKKRFDNVANTLNGQTT